MSKIRIVLSQKGGRRVQFKEKLLCEGIEKVLSPVLFGKGEIWRGMSKHVQD